MLFVDMGHSHTAATLSRLGADKGEILFELAERNLGGRDLDVEVGKLVAKIFEQQSGIDVLTKPKSWLVLIEAVQKARSTLSIDNQAKIKVASLVAGQNFEHIITQADFIEAISMRLQ